MSAPAWNPLQPLADLSAAYAGFSFGASQIEIQDFVHSILFPRRVTIEEFRRRRDRFTPRGPRSDVV